MASSSLQVDQFWAALSGSGGRRREAGRELPPDRVACSGLPGRLGGRQELLVALLTPNCFVEVPGERQGLY